MSQAPFSQTFGLGFCDELLLERRTGSAYISKRPHKTKFWCMCEPTDVAQSVSDDTHAVGTRPTQASEHGRRRRVSPFVSVGGMPGPSIWRELCFEQARELDLSGFPEHM